MQDITQAQREDFFDSFTDGSDKENGYYDSMFTEGRPTNIFDWHTSSIKQIIQALIEMEENRLKECEQCDNREIHETDPWNQAKQDNITHLKQLLDNLQ